jgi:aldehyde dehydrogenase (NAD+)
MTQLQRQNYDGSPSAVSDEVLQRHREAASFLPEGPYDLHIGGELVDTDGGSVEQAIDVITGETLAEFTIGSAADVDRAVDAALEAYVSEWKETAPNERAVYLEEIADRLDDEKEELAMRDTLEAGDPVVTGTNLVDLAANNIRYFASLARTADQGSRPTVNSPTDDDDGNRTHHVYTNEQPFGVVGIIPGWNAAVSYAGFKFAPILAAGNTAVFKPAPRCVLSVIRAAEIMTEVLPDGVVNIVPGTGPEVGEAITTHPGIRKVSLTGSVGAGKAAMKGAASNVKDVHLELGGKGPHIIFPDADLDQAAQNAAVGVFSYTGQKCTALSRVFVPEDIHDEFLDQLVATTQLMFDNPGDPLEEGTTLGPLVDHEHLDRVASYVETAVEEGATVAFGGERADTEGLGDAPFYRPTILTGVDNEDTVACEEVFGPVLSVLEYSDPDDAIEMANDTEFGLTAALWTQDVSRAHRAAARIEAGTVWVNQSERLGDGYLHGGFKQSGLGREMGKETYHDYRETKLVDISLTDESFL